MSASVETPEARRERLLGVLKSHREAVQQVMQFEQNLDSETKSLDAVDVDSVEHLAQHPSEVYAAYSELQKFARGLNLQLPVPEIVFIGPAGHGKSALIEAILGQVFTGEGGTKRPMTIQVVNNPQCVVPRCTLKRDTFLKEFNHDEEVPIERLTEELQKRNQPSEVPFILQWEHCSCINSLLFDMPGFIPDPSDPSFSKIEELALEFIKPSHRMIVVVRPCVDIQIPDASDFVMDLVRKCDPSLNRTVLLYTRLFAQLQQPEFHATSRVNKFLSGSVVDASHQFFATLLSRGLRATLTESYDFTLKLAKCSHRDLLILEQKQFDKRFEKTIGIPAFLTFLLEHTTRTYKNAIPTILKRLRQENINNSKKMAKLMEEEKCLAVESLRSSAVHYVVQFVKTIESLLEGTAEGYPTIHGQTLEQEKQQCGIIGQWADSTGALIEVQPNLWNVPYWDHKVYGGQQFNRLLSEFKAVSEHSQLPEVSDDEIATATGVPKQTNLPNFVWAACDIAKQKTQEVFMPLIEELLQRASFVVKRLPVIAAAIISMHEKNSPGIQGRSVGQYPFFTNHVHDLFNTSVDHFVKVCKEKCMDEFFSTHTIYWDLTHNYKTLTASTVTEVVPLTQQLFTMCKERIASNVILKCHNYLLTPLLTDLWAEIHTKVNAIPSEALQKLFEVEPASKSLQIQKKKLKAIIDKSASNEQKFVELSSQFTHSNSGSS
ncbi:dynamin family protein [Pelomyxa schiedti]|nr:dynamin family protein [Pelomyxa schiedti]